jgi:U3 small nucleolar RNA-associated protein MPP10
LPRDKIAEPSPSVLASGISLGKSSRPVAHILHLATHCVDKMATTEGPLLWSLTNAQHEFLQPSLPLYTDTLAFLKHALDPLAADVSAVQQQRQQEARKKRKRGREIADAHVLRLKQIHIDALGPEQIWEQARRVINAAREEAERGLAEARELDGPPDFSATAEELEAEEGEDADEDEHGADYVVEGEDGGEEEYDEDEDEQDLDDALGAADGGEQDDYEDDDDMDTEDEDGLGNDEPAQEFVADKFGLNDGFFSIDDFNKQSEFLEQQDLRGDDDGAASDEEDVDWDADPLGQPASANGKAGPAPADEEEEDEEHGPTFGDPDAPSGDEDEGEGGEMDGVGDMGLGNTNDIMYADFFAPPAQSQKKKKNKKGRPNPHNFPAATDKSRDGEEDVQRTMDAVHRDLFDDEDEEDEEQDGEEEQLDPSDPRSRRSTHERRKAALAEEIRKLEAANVAKREWTLSGEARAADRPLNSLLEEDLEFERAGKPVPVITAEVSESIEELIKRRILAHDFQDLIRRRPDDLATGKAGRRGKLDIEINDTNNRKGLAEEYEEDHLRRTDPHYVDAKSVAQQKQEKEIEALWNKIRSDLDSLSSWHFRPKAPAPQLDIRVDAPTITMEDAQPTVGGDVGGTSQLAPQEIYKGGEGSKETKEEVVGKSGLPEAREEMGREDKKRRRRREKERIRKAQGQKDVPAAGAKTGEASGKGGKEKKGKNEVIGELKKGGVKVIGKKGKVTDVEGREARAGGVGGPAGAGVYKL